MESLERLLAKDCYHSLSPLFSFLTSPHCFLSSLVAPFSPRYVPWSFGKATYKEAARVDLSQVVAGGGGGEKGK